jgi:hypothetical protein
MQVRHFLHSFYPGCSQSDVVIHEGVSQFYYTANKNTNLLRTDDTFTTFFVYFFFRSPRYEELFREKILNLLCIKIVV